ncbi:MAG: RNA polymerase sigma factor [Candidatus Zixiibacteriota bacterium]|nr:MAG: RNA polymerase sigma factor [candidate division Zixibacteria bacterium]
MDNELFWKLLKPVHPMAAAFCRKLTGDSDDGDDLYQEALMVALRRLGSLKDHTAFRPWLIRIIISRFKNRLRSLWHRRRVSLTPAMLETATGFDPQEEFAARRLLDELLGVLSPEDRAIIVLHEIDGWSVADIAGTLGKPRGTVKTRLFRARAKMRERLERHLARCRTGQNDGGIAYALRRCKTVDG